MMEKASANPGEGQEKMRSMIDACCGGMGADAKREMIATIMGKMTEGLDMKEMMPRMMMGMMSGGADDGPGKKQEMMAKMMQGGPEQHMAQMPEMMLKMMMPHCVGMMLPAIEADKRGEVAAGILSAIVEKGSAGMSDEQKRFFVKSLEEALHPAA